MRLQRGLASRSRSGGGAAVIGSLEGPPVALPIIAENIATRVTTR